MDPAEVVVGEPEHYCRPTALMKASDTWDQFKRMLDKALLKHKRLPLFDGIEPEVGR